MTDLKSCKTSMAEKEERLESENLKHKSVVDSLRLGKWVWRRKQNFLLVELSIYNCVYP